MGSISRSAMAERMMQPCIVRLEVPREPGVKPLRQELFVEQIRHLVIFHDVADLVEQAFVIVLVPFDRASS